MSKTRKILLAILSALMAISMLFAVACSNGSIQIKTIPPVVQHRVGESINLYDYVERQAGVTYTFAMAFEDGEPEQLTGNGYYLAEVGEYTLTINAKKGNSTASATMTFSAIDVNPTLWSNEEELTSSWLSYTLLYKLLDEAGPFAMPIETVKMELTHMFVYPAEDDTYGYKVDLTGVQSYVEEFKTANPDVLTPIEITEENVEDVGFYVKRRKLKDDQTAIKASDGKYYGEKNMGGIIKFLIEGRYEFHYKAYNDAGTKTSRFFVNCTEKLYDLNEIKDSLTFDRETFVATWKPVEGAVKYKVKLLNKNYFVEDTSFDCSDIIKNRIMDFTLVVLPIGANQEKPNDYINDSKMTYETPYFGSAGTTLNEDGSITIKGVNPPGELYLNIASIKNDYYALRGDFEIGSFIDVTFKGNNLPTVLLFADEINDNLTYQGGRGIAVVNGLHSSNEGGNEYPGLNNIYGPNRMNTHYSYSPLGRLPKEFSQAAALERAEENPDTLYKYTLGTRLDNAGSLVVVASLTNLDTGKLISTSESRLWYWYDATRDPKALTDPRYLDATDVEAGDIVLYAPWKDNAEDCTFISVSDPYYVDPNPVIYNEDGSVSLYSQVPSGQLYGSFNGTSNSYVAHEGEYDVGTFVDFEFTGNNMPSVMFFADEVNSIMGFQGGKGIIAVNGILSRAALDGAENPQTGSYKIFGPNRVNMHYNYGHLAQGPKEFTQDSLNLSPDRKYKYTVGTRVDGEGLLRWVAELYDAGTGEMIKSVDTKLYHSYDTESDPKKLENPYYLTPADVKAGSIVAYAMFKGTSDERTTFKMSDPYYPDTEISKGNAAQNEDGSYTLNGANVGALWSGPNGATGSIGYVAHNGVYGAGMFVEYIFTGNNMPQVLLFADNMNGNMTGNGGGKGILLLNGIQNSTVGEGGAVTHAGTKNNFQIYGPNRMSGHFPSYAAYRLANTSGAPTMQYFINNSTTEFRYVVGTKVVYEDVNLYEPIDGNWVGQDGFVDAVIYVVIELYNNETGALVRSIETKLISTYNAFDKTTLNKYLTVDDVNPGHIVAFATLKGLNDDGTVAKTTFTVSKKPYTPETSGDAHVHDFNKYANDGTYHWVECECGAKFDKTACAGGTATCTELATCDTCGFKYGETIPHVGGTATCFEAATCEACGNKYGTYGHDFTTATEGSIVIDGDYHRYHCGKCDSDTENELHFGGEATLEDLAKCTVCGAEHGDYLPPVSNNEVTLINIKDTASVEFDGKRTLTAESGSLTFSADGASAIAIVGAEASDFIKLNFTATGDAVEAMAIRFRQSSATANWQSGWGIVPNNSHGMMLNWGGNYYMNRINDHGKYTSVIGAKSVEALNDFTKDKKYAYMFGIVGEGEDKVLHFAILDETNGTVMRYVTWSWTQIAEYAVSNSDPNKHKDLSNKAIADTGYYVIDFTAAVVNKTISYQTFAADEAIYMMSGSKAVEITGYERSNITWTAVTGAVSYAVKVDDGDWTNVGNVTNYVIPNLVEGEEYTAQVKAIFEKTESKAGELTFVYSSHVHDFKTLKTDNEYHWYVCDCEQETEKVAHTGGTATTSAQAVCTGCGQGYGNTAIPNDLKVVGADVFVANDGSAPSATKGSVTIGGGTDFRNAATIGIKQSTTTEFLKVSFKSLKDATNTNAARDLQSSIKLWFGIRRTEAQITTDSLASGAWGAGARTDSQDCHTYYGSSAVLFDGGKLTSNWYWSAGNLALDDDCYCLIGVDNGAIRYIVVNETKNKTLINATLKADTVSAKGALPENGYFSIHSWADEERTISWEIISADAAAALIV